MSRQKLALTLTFGLILMGLAWLGWLALQSQRLTLTSEPVLMGKQVDKLTPMTASQVFSRLRHAQMLGSHFYVWRYNPTSQRMIVITNDSADAEIYNTLYRQNLSMTQFSILLQLLKHQSKFENSAIEVQRITLGNTGELHQGQARLNYKQYSITLRINGKPEQYEAYIAKVQQNQVPWGLLFTFNSKGYTSLKPFQELLNTLETPATPSTEKALSTS